MKQFLSHYENFFFRALNFRTRATPLEYWAVIPVIWFFMIYLLMGDIAEVWGFLLQRQLPPMNPLYYGSVIVFVLTLLPRAAVNIRRLHDRNKSGFFILLPGVAMLSSIVLLSGLCGAMMNSSLTGRADGPDELYNVVYPLLLFVADPNKFWNEMFQIAQAFQKLGSEAVWGLLAEIYAHSGAVDVRREVDDITNEIEGNTGHTVGFFFISIALVTTPFITSMLHALINILPSHPEDNLYGPAQISALVYKKKKDDKHNPMAGYAHLFEATKEEKAAKREANAQEVKALYRSRVLGQPDP